jgi:tRNA threonylcarbamoyladenosine biosynthesis protein TsaB
MLTVFIDEMLKGNGIRACDLEAVAVGKGPGSYTGLRIGVSVAKGIAYAASIPVIGIETTLSMFWGMHSRIPDITRDIENTLLCPMIDARRMEVYDAIYDAQGNTFREISAEIISETSFAEIPESKKIIFFGDGSAKCREHIKRKNVYFAEDFRISASYMQIPVYHALDRSHFENVAYFEPFYLKDFITSLPRKNILGN